MRLVSRGPLDSPWGLAIAPQGFAGLSAPSSDPVLLVGNFGDGFIHAFDATTGPRWVSSTTPTASPSRSTGCGPSRSATAGAGGAADTVYFTAGPFGESHGLFGSLTTATAGSPEGPAEAQWVQANLDVVQLDLTARPRTHRTARRPPPSGRTPGPLLPTPTPCSCRAGLAEDARHDSAR